MDDKTEDLWYKEGLKFECTGCGQCCTGSPGYAWVSDEEIEQMAQFLQLSVTDFRYQYIRVVKGRLALLERPVTYDCIFLHQKKCQIYPVRPKQCRTFPWWPQNLKSKKDWKEAAKFCEGIREEAPLITLSTIQKQLEIQETE